MGHPNFHIHGVANGSERYSRKWPKADHCCIRKNDTDSTVPAVGRYPRTVLGSWEDGLPCPGDEGAFLLKKLGFRRYGYSVMGK
jgi:hypothetical protein